MSVRAVAVACAIALAVCATAELTAGTSLQAPAGTDDEERLGGAPQILVIFSHDPSQSWIRILTDALMATEHGPRRLSAAWYFEHLDAVRFQDPDRGRQFRDAIAAKYRNRRLHLIVAVASNAIAFVHAAHDELWPGIPVLAANYAGRTLGGSGNAPWQSTLTFEGGFDEAIAALKTVFPDTTAVAMVSGISPTERRNESEIGSVVRRAGLAFIDVQASSINGLASQVRHLPARAVLFLAGGQLDADGSAVPTWRMCEVLSRGANQPAVMLGSQFLGCGIVGGLMRDYSKIGAVIGDHALAIVAGEPRRMAVVPFMKVATLEFDARQLERWSVDERRLPPGSLVAYRAPSLWRDYRHDVAIVSIAFVVQSALIVGLLYERRARRKAEIDSRRSLAVAALAERRTTVTALTGAIAHELNQPLGSILHNACAAEMLVASNHAPPEVLQAILRDIRNDDARAAQIIQRHRSMLKKHDMEQRPLNIHVVVRDSLALLTHDAEERQVQIHTAFSPPGAMVIGDTVLLQQVVVNLVINAMDAMDDLPPGRRRVDVRIATTGAGVEIAVRDSGPGMSPELERVLFEPFVTTKADGIGIGLTIVRRIVEAHGGTIDARNNPEGGATFRFTLPAEIVA